VIALDRFIRAGGTLVCFNRSSQFVITQLRLPVTNAVAGINRREFTASGSLLRVIVDPAHRVTAGMPAEAAVYFDGSPAFVPGEGFKGTILARYPDTGSPLLSGFILGDQHLHGRAAAVELEHGDGRIVLFGFRPQWRGQPFGTFRLIFNAAIYAR
jgi:ribosomal protein S18 acetylase RimI-like enzyme